MGNKESRARDDFVIPDVADVEIPMQYARLNQSESNDPLGLSTISTNDLPKKIIHTAFNGIWSVVAPERISPQSRSGHFTVVDEENQIAYIGYGTSSNGEPLCDFWAFDLSAYTWRNIKLVGNGASPRNGARAVLFNNKIYIFGGFLSGVYTNELQSIDIQTGTVTVLETKGDIPERRSVAIMGLYNGKIFVWGGYNGQWLNSIHILDINTMVWSTIPTNEKGRSGVPSVVVDYNLISYGGSHTDGLFTINMADPKIKIVPTTGFAPQSEVMNAGMVRANNLVFYFGGKDKNSNYTILYALDYDKKWWFIFHVKPDGESVTMLDGNVSDNGIFMLPRIHSFGVAYSKVHRTIVAFLGLPYSDPPNLFLISIGEALGFINLRNDMSDALRYTSL
ncbi:hypothetical protein M9Y10_016325 [Tritrichomonas musculus]|uniref:Kelch motif family protein n=1 Tax=Tritrichomonas musculus TaxID=1915356 RepID=A0ABR2HWU6_9EUKA